MNFLAHIYLSGANEMVRLGNFSADGVRGKNYLNYPEAIQVGMLLHRTIDTFTDAHPIVRQSTKRLHKKYGHYSGVIVDIFYDHFLAKNWATYSEEKLPEFIQQFYKSLTNHLDILPERIQVLAPKMIAGNWLLSYTNLEGMQRVLNGMNTRTKGIVKMNEATTELKLHYSDFEKEFTAFFNALQTHSQSTLKTLETQYNL